MKIVLVKMDASKRCASMMKKDAVISTIVTRAAKAVTPWASGDRGRTIRKCGVVAPVSLVHQSGGYAIERSGYVVDRREMQINSAWRLDTTYEIVTSLRRCSRRYIVTLLVELTKTA